MVRKKKEDERKIQFWVSSNQHINGNSSKLCGRLISELVSSISSAKNEREKELAEKKASDREKEKKKGIGVILHIFLYKL